MQVCANPSSSGGTNQVSHLHNLNVKRREYVLYKALVIIHAVLLWGSNIASGYVMSELWDIIWPLKWSVVRLLEGSTCRVFKLRVHPDAWGDVNTTYRACSGINHTAWPPPPPPCALLSPFHNVHCLPTLRLIPKKKLKCQRPTQEQIGYSFRMCSFCLKNQTTQSIWAINCALVMTENTGWEIHW